MHRYFCTVCQKPHRVRTLPANVQTPDGFRDGFRDGFAKTKVEDRSGQCQRVVMERSSERDELIQRLVAQAERRNPS